MTTVAESPATSTPTPAPAGRVTGFLRRHRIWLVVVVAFLAAVLITALTRASPEYGDPYDPQNPGPDGAQALARVLEDQGVEVTIVRDAAAFEDERVDRRTTVVVTGAERLAASTSGRLQRHAADGDLVLVDPTAVALADVPARLRPAGALPDRVRADCEEYAGLRLTADAAIAWGERARGCFATTGGPLLAEADDGTVVFGAGQALTNDQILRADNAAIGLRLLGQNPRLVWYLPSYDDAAADETVSLGSLLPRWIVPALWLLLVAGGALAWWRGRRLGALSVEPLPVVVRAVETARSRGRMYRRGNDRAHAAGALRAATRRRVAERLGLGHGAAEAAVVAAVAERLARPAAEVAALLGSAAPPPATDADLVALADALARTTREVGQG